MIPFILISTSVFGATSSGGNLEIKKSASEYKNDKATITLDVKGTALKTDAKKADIVLVIDKSGSMEDKLKQVQTAAKKFSENILSNNEGGRVRISVVSFDYNERNYATLGKSSYVNTNFTSDNNTINTAINSIKADGGTHTQDGIWRAADILNGARSDANKYVVFFTDGLPTQSVSGGDGTQSLDKFFKDAQKEYYKNFIGFGAPTKISIGGIGEKSKDDDTIPPAESITVSNTPKFKDVKFYSVGVFTKSTALEAQQGTKFLKTIQNVIEESKFGEKYVTQKLTDIDSIFMDISNEIKESIYESIADNVVINDVVTKEFNIIKDSIRVIDLNGNVVNVPKENIKITTNNGSDEIAISFDKIKATITDANGVKSGGLKVMFDITKKDPYFSGENIKTNVEAFVSYKNPSTGTPYKDYFKEVPTVNIEKKLGSIKVTKNIRNDKGEIVTDDTPFEIVIERKKSSDDPSNIVENNKKYTLKSTESKDTGVKHLIGNNTVSPDGKQILSTIVSNKDNYLIAGEYVVKEINMPTNNYDLKEIKINGTTISNSGSGYEGSFVLSKDSPNIDIEVVNQSIKPITLDKTATEASSRIYEINLIVNKNGVTASNGKIMDVVTNEFEILQDNFYNGKVFSMKNLATGQDISLDKINSNINGNIISWEGVEVPQEGISIKFRIKVKNDYYGGLEVSTNTTASFEYTDYKGDKVTKLFPVPQVNIPFIRGVITIEKEIVEKDSNGNWVTSIGSNNKKFSISVVGEEKYTIDLEGNEKQSMCYYLRDKDTDISSNYNMYFNYITAGTFDIEEIIPMNYEQVQIWINPSGNEGDPWVKLEDFLKDSANINSGRVKNGKLVIDKVHPNLNIKVSNTLVNKSYWIDDSQVPNGIMYDKRTVN
ncbi:MAG: vWA domain-containing protein [Clostridium sp.]